MQQRAALMMMAIFVASTLWGADAFAAGLVVARKIAVYPLQGLPAQQRIRSVVSHALIAELRKLQAVQVIGIDEIADMLDHEQNRQLLGCDDEGCATEIANALGVDEIVTGSLMSMGEKSVINLRRIDVMAGKVVKVFDLRLEPRQGEEYLAVVGDAVETLYAGYELRQGARRGVSAVVAKALNAPPLPPWFFWTTTAAGLGLAVTTGAATAMVLWAASVHNDLAANSVAPGQPVADVDLQRRRQLAQGWDIARWSLLGATSFVLVAVGFEALLTDWQGAGEADPILLLDQAAGPRLSPSQTAD